MTVEHVALLAPDGTPATLAPISAATVHDGVVYASGQAAVDAATGAILAGTVEEQAEICLTMLAAVLERAGASMSGVLRAECFLARREDFAAFNTAFARHFPGPAPARTTVICDFALEGLLVEVQAVAALPSATA